VRVPYRAMRTAPFGSWPSPITAAGIAVGSLRLSQPRLAGGAVLWCEGRPAEGGRQALMRRDGEGRVTEVLPSGANARTRVYEYGGGDYAVRGNAVFYVELADQRVYVRGSAAAPRALTPPGPRYADLDPSPDGRFLAAVEESPRAGREPEHRAVAIPVAGGEPVVVGAGRDFFAFPRFSPDGRRLAFTAWDHPRMPWDGSELFVAEWSERGPAGAPRCVAGGSGESIFQPAWSPAGRLLYVSDRTGWWNLDELGEDGPRPLCPREAEFGRPQWALGMSTWDFVSEDVLLCAVVSGGRERLCRLERGSGALVELDLPYTAVEGVRVEGGRAVFVGASPTRAPAICALDLESGGCRELRTSLPEAPDPAFVSVPEAVSFPTADGTPVHALLYRPAHPECAGPAGGRPPLLVKSHGGPTGAARTALDPRLQFWTSRGFAVIDVDYRGSTGYGRAYRELLKGAWGVADVDDCCAAARYAADAGCADPERLAITGGSAGGYTTLCALAFRDVFRSGASHYGVGDLEALARDTHKFEAHYLDGLVGPYPEAAARYRERSPVHFAERIACPVIFFQGSEDRIVPRDQAEAMVAALAARGVPHAFVLLEGEGHGFRRADSIRTALEGELFFHAAVFGFPVDVRPPGVVLRGLAEPTGAP